MKETARHEKKSWIPSISDERLRELFEKIKPVVDFGKKGLRYIKQEDLRNIAYTWDPKPAKKAKNLYNLCDITTYHSYGHYVLFKPSIAEVLAQIPKEHLDKVIAFEIVKSPETADDLNREREATNAGYHVAMTRLYVQK